MDAVKNEKTGTRLFKIKKLNPDPVVSLTADEFFDKDLVENPFAPFEDKADPRIPTATFQIYDFINEYLKRGQDTHVFRASSAPYCAKRLWYQRQGTVGLPLTPRKVVNFLLGDLSERSLLYFIRQSCLGPGKLYSEVDFGNLKGAIQFQGKDLEIYEQQTLSATVEGLPRITAHVDGWGRRNTDGKWELIECKSASDFGYKDFVKGAKPPEYLPQAMTCLNTDKGRELAADGVRYFYLKKQTGHVWDRYYAYDESQWQLAISRFKTALADAEPERPYLPIAEMTGRSPNKKPTGREILEFPCTYCPFIEKCQPPFTVEWNTDYSQTHQKPTYVIKKDVTDAF